MITTIKPQAVKIWRKIDVDIVAGNIIYPIADAEPLDIEIMAIGEFEQKTADNDPGNTVDQSLKIVCRKLNQEIINTINQSPLILELEFENDIWRAWGNHYNWVSALVATYVYKCEISFSGRSVTILA